ncbi:Mannonate dehydratase [Granulicella sibirica]|uniref:mannonate dehydratase n=2 Tax=Granulicella sibirica TaxID=2479048 RepID=A0A4Q0T285_9BACT|nr:Mannonate dehydratase [Granulicella sibirica]
MSGVNRRQFLSVSSAAALSLNSGVASGSAPKRKPLVMKLGCQTAPTTDEHLKYLARYGVKNICGYPVIADERLYATVDELQRMKDLAAKNGIEVDMIAPPFLASISVDVDKHAAIMLGQSPERDHDIEAIQTLIKNCAAAGIPAIKYNLQIVGDARIARTAGRGDAMYATWKFSEAHPKTPLTRAGNVSAEESWARITYFLDRVIPVANEYKVRMALHPDDPGVPPQGYQGDHRVLGTVDGLKRFVSIQESAYHGLNFCQGTVSEMLADPGKEIFDVIRYFGTRDKIFNVHFRNIRGHRDDFVETFPDEGDVDFVRAIRTYQEVGYKYMIMPDHVPQAETDPKGLQSFAFCYGYIRGLLQSAAEPV